MSLQSWLPHFNPPLAWNAKNICVDLMVNTRTALNGTFSSQNPLSELRKFLETELMFDKLSRGEDVLKMIQLINLFSYILCEKLCRFKMRMSFTEQKNKACSKSNFSKKKYYKITAI